MLALQAYSTRHTSIHFSATRSFHGGITIVLQNTRLGLYLVRRLVLISGSGRSLLSGSMLPRVRDCRPPVAASTHNVPVFFNKSTKAMPYISAQYRTTSLLDSLRSCIAQVPIPDTFGRTINLAPWPKNIGEKGVVRFVENGRIESTMMKRIVCKPDIVVLATGYTQTFKFLDETYPRPADANMRSIFDNKDATVGFIGFVRPSFGKCSPEKLHD